MEKKIKRKTCSFSLDPKLYQQIKVIGATIDVPANILIESAISKVLEKYKNNDLKVPERKGIERDNISNTLNEELYFELKVLTSIKRTKLNYLLEDALIDEISHYKK